MSSNRGTHTPPPDPRDASAACTCGKGDEAPAIVHADDCPCIDWVAGSLEGGESRTAQGSGWTQEYECSKCGLTTVTTAEITVGPMKCWRSDCPGAAPEAKPQLRLVKP